MASAAATAYNPTNYVEESEPSYDISNYIEKTLPFPTNTVNTCYSPNGKLLVGCTLDGVVRLFDVEHMYQLIGEYQHSRYHIDAESDAENINPAKKLHFTQCLAFSPNSKWLVIANQLHLVILDASDLTAKPLFSISDMDKLPNVDATRKFCSATFNKDGSVLAIGMHNSVCLLNVLDNFVNVLTFPAIGKVTQFIFHENDYIIASQDGPVQRISATCVVLATYAYRVRETTHLMHMSISPRGLLCCGYYDHEPQVLNPLTLEVVATLQLYYPVTMRLTHLNADVMVTSGGIRGYTLWDMNTFEQIKKFEEFNTSYHMSDAKHYEGNRRSFSPDNRNIAVANNKNILVYMTPLVAHKKLSNKLSVYAAYLIDTKDPEYEGIEFDADTLITMAQSML